MNIIHSGEVLRKTNQEPKSSGPLNNNQKNQLKESVNSSLFEDQVQISSSGPAHSLSENSLTLNSSNLNEFLSQTVEKINGSGLRSLETVFSNINPQKVQQLISN